MKIKINLEFIELGSLQLFKCIRCPKSNSSKYCFADNKSMFHYIVADALIYFEEVNVSIPKVNKLSFNSQFLFSPKRQKIQILI